MGQKQIKNTLEKGLVTDFSKNNVPPNQYIRGVNVTLSKDGQYTAMTNLRGNEGLANIFVSSLAGAFDEYQVLGLFYIDWFNKTDGENRPCLTAFIARPSTQTYNVYVYDLVDNQIDTVLTVPFPTEAFEQNKSIDPVIFGENGKNILYFTDGYNKPKRLVCEYPGGISDIQSTLLKRGASTPIVATPVPTGGSLVCGAYQFAYRLINKDNKKYTNFSLLTNPIKIFQEPNDVDEQLAVGDIGNTTSSKINLGMTIPSAALAEYDYVQIAVLENVDSLNYPPLSARLLEPVLATQIFTYSYSSNTGGILIDAGEITTDKAAIESWKTMTIKDNVMIAGNIKYKDLSYNNGEPTIGAGSDFIIRTDFGVTDPEDTRLLYSQQHEASNYVGHFRDEVYRYYVTYYDDEGNYSRPKPLPMNLMSTNYATSGTDLKFPPRSDPDYSLLDSSGNIQSIGLSIVGLDNHPTWAAGFAILRAKRKKDIMFQSPLVPSILVQPAAALDTYPTAPQEPGEITTLDQSTNQPPVNQSGTYVPKNFFHVVNRSIVKVNPSATLDTFGQVKYESSGDTSFGSGAITDSSFTAYAGGSLASISSISSDFRALGFEPGMQVQLTGYANSENNVNAIIKSINVAGDAMTVSTLDGGFTFITEASPASIIILHWVDTNAELTGSYHVHSVYGPEYMYKDINGQPFVDYNVSSNDKLETVDVAFLRTIFTKYDGDLASGYLYGDRIDTTVSGSFFAVAPGDYYYQDGVTYAAPSVDNNNAKISSFDIVPNETEKTVLSTSVGTMQASDYGDYIGLDADGLSEGYTPDNVRCGVIVTREPKQDVASLCFSGTTGYRTATTITSQATHFSGINPDYSQVNSNYLFGNYSPSGSEAVGAVEIVNVRRGLSDDRYGDAEAEYDLVFTGASYEFSVSERNTLQSTLNPSIPKTIEVWGGDCYIGLATVKIGNSIYSVVNSTRTDNTGSENQATIEAKWQTSFRTTQGANTFEIRRPIPLKGAHQSISVFLETEINLDALPRLTYSETTAIDGVRIPRPSIKNPGAVRLVQDYSYFPAYSAENINKAFVPFKAFEDNLTDFRSRLLYSDTKIYQSSIEGFDSFKAGNVYDMDESFGPITKLERAANDIFALQESGIAYVPVNANLIETDDVSQLQVRDNEFIGNIKYVNTFNGCRDIRTVSRTPSGFIFYDSSNKALLNVMSREGVSELNELGVLNLFNNELPDEDLDDRNIFSNYDVNEKKYLLTWTDPSQKISKTFVYNGRLGLWEGNEDYETNGRLLGSTYGDKNIYHIGIDYGSTQKSMGLYQNDKGVMNTFFNQKVTPSVTIMINPEPDYTKVYDNLRIYSNGPLETANMLVERLDDSERQRAFGMNLDIEPREEYYRLKVLRDEVGRRLRGPKAELTLEWDKFRDEEISLFSVTTKYRPSSRIA